jgi:diacylglycerol kinase family enzyme
MVTGTTSRISAMIFVNASSGWDRKDGIQAKLEDWFRQAGIDAHVECVERGANLAQKTRDAVASGHKIVAGAGGDGTLSAVASGLAGTGVSFGILPAGTLNHFARDLNLPLDLESAAKLICDGNTADIDIAEVNGKTFLNNSIIGLYPVFRFLRGEQERRGMPRKIALLWAAAGAFRRYPFFTVRMFFQGREVVRRTPYLLIANNEHGMQGWQLGVRKRLDEGRLWIYVMKPQSRTALLWMTVKLIFGQFDGRHHFDIFTAEEFYVDTRSKRIGVALDGEIRVMETPLRYRILPRSLKVFVPR